MPQQKRGSQGIYRYLRTQSVFNIGAMDSTKKHRTFAALDDVTKDLVELLSEGTELTEDDQSYIECHLRLIQLTYSNWKQGPIQKSPLAA